MQRSQKINIADVNPLSTNPTEWSDTTQTIRRQIADKLFECV